jgi:hypothetical protein
MLLLVAACWGKDSVPAGKKTSSRKAFNARCVEQSQIVGAQLVCWTAQQVR